MKGTLWCKIFGHKFIKRVRHVEKASNATITIPYDISYSLEPSETCWHCGLTRKELDIGSGN